MYNEKRVKKIGNYLSRLIQKTWGLCVRLGTIKRFFNKPHTVAPNQGPLRSKSAVRCNYFSQVTDKIVKASLIIR